MLIVTGYIKYKIKSMVIKFISKVSKYATEKGDSKSGAGGYITRINISSKEYFGRDIVKGFSLIQIVAGDGVNTALPSSSPLEIKTVKNNKSTIFTSMCINLQNSARHV